MALETGAVDVEGKAVLVPEEAELGIPRGPPHLAGHTPAPASSDPLPLIAPPQRTRYLWPPRGARHQWTDSVASSAPPVVVMGDFNKDAIRDPQLNRVVEEWGYRVQPPRWAWTWRGAGAHAGQHSMIDFVLVLEGLPMRECRLVGRMLVRTDH